MSGDADDLGLEAQRDAIEAMRRLFQEEKNPLFAWDAYARARGSGLPIPEWVSAYLDEVAKGLGVLVNQVERGHKLKDPAVRTSAALGMEIAKGQPTSFRRFANKLFDWDWLAVGERVAAYVRAGNNQTDAIDLVRGDLEREEEHAQEIETQFWAEIDPSHSANDQHGVPSISTIRAAYLRYAKEFPDRTLPK